MMVFVFGSNLRGVHGAGAAAYAVKHEGAVFGEGIGYHGNSYAIPTKDYTIQTLSLAYIIDHINKFIEFANKHSELEFKVTQIGCGLAGYTAGQMAPLFRDAPFNCYFDSVWAWYLPEHKVWGTV